MLILPPRIDMQEPTDHERPARRDPENLVGAEIANRFTVLECIGKGGMGVVYTAKQHALDREVVLKVVRSEDAAPEAKDRFRREASVLSKLSHPNVVQIYDHGRDVDKDLWFIAMEYVRGITLSRYLKQRGGVLPVRDFRIIATQILQGVAEAHRLGMVHRDLKPANIMLASKGDKGKIQVKVLDFGLSKLVKEAEPLTQGHQMLGSAMYMAPEQLKSQKLTARADVYALGVIFYQLLSGKKPIEGPDSVQVIAQQLAGGTRPLLEALGSQTDVPMDLVRLVESCLSVDPKNRPEDAAALLSMLEHGFTPVTRVASADVAPMLTPAMLAQQDGPTDSTMRTGPTASHSSQSETRARVGMWAGLAGGGVALVVAVLLGIVVIFLLLRDLGQEPAVAVVEATPEARAEGLDQATKVLRERGLTAMRDGDYDRAVNLITEAVMLAPGEADLKELLTIAIDLRDTESEKAAKAATEAEKKEEEDKDDGVAAVAPRPKPSPRAKPSPRRRTSKPSPKPPPLGMAVITSIPKARVEVAGHGEGTTPYRVEDIPVGSYAVTFFVDGKRVHGTTMKVGSDSVELLDVDLAPYLPKPEPEPEPEPKPAPAPAPAPAPTAAPAPKPEPEAATAGVAPDEQAVGELFVDSPNVFGAIWINGKNHGTTPVIAKNLPVGPVTIEVRVGKNVRRTHDAVVVADTRKKITIR